MNPLKTALTPLVNLGNNARRVLDTVTRPCINMSLVHEARRNATQQARNGTQWLVRRLKPTPKPPIPSRLNPAARWDAIQPFAKAIREFVTLKNELGFSPSIAVELRHLAILSEEFCNDLDAIDAKKGLEASEAQRFTDAVRRIVETTIIADTYLSTEQPYQIREAADALLTKVQNIQTLGYAFASKVAAEESETPAPLSDVEKLNGFEVLGKMPQSDELSALRRNLQPWLAAHLERKADLDAAMSASDPDERNLRLQQTCETLQNIHNLTLVYAEHAKATMPAPTGLSVDPRVEELFKLISEMEYKLELYARSINAIQAEVHQLRTAPPTDLEKRFDFEVLAEMPTSDELSAFRVTLNQLLDPYEKTVDDLTNAIKESRPDRFKLLGQAYTTLNSIYKATYDFANQIEDGKGSFDSSYGDDQVDQLFELADEIHAELTSFWNDMSNSKDRMRAVGYII